LPHVPEADVPRKQSSVKRRTCPFSAWGRERAGGGDTMEGRTVLGEGTQGEGDAAAQRRLRLGE